MTTFADAAAKLEFDKVRERILRYAASDPGRDLLRELPFLTSDVGVREELERVSEMKRLLEEEEGCPLDGIRPIHGSVVRASIEGSVLQGNELAAIVATLRASRALRGFLARRKETSPLLWEMAEPLAVDKVLEYNIEHAVDETGAVRASASRELQAIRRSIAESYDQLKKRLGGILKEVAEQGLSQEEIITTREGRMVIPVKAEHKNRVPGFIHSASSSGATVFIEPTVTLELNNAITNLQFAEQREIARILRTLTAQVGAAREMILPTLEILAELDGLHARAKYSIEVMGNAPTVNREGALRLIDARHPILLIAHGREGTIPLSLELGTEAKTLVISGPNAGGKSVAMKCVGLLILMTQAGIHIPAAAESSVPVMEDLFVDIGDEQSIESDLSTFSSHLKNLKGIASAARPRTLVLIDEIGSGTDPSEGGAIAAAVLEWLTRSGALTIATTHQGVLKVFAHETPEVINGAMEFDQTTLTPTYRFRPGIPGSSYALEMADRLGFQKPLMERSRALLGEEQHRMESLLTELESAVQQYRADSAELSRERAEAAELAKSYTEKMREIRSEMKELRRRAVEDAQAIVEKANAAIEESIRRIRESGGKKETVREARETVRAVREEISREAELVAEPPPEAARAIAEGETVTIHGGGNPGEVLQIAPDGKSALVVFGNVRMRVPLSDLRPTPKKERRRDQVAEIRTEKQASATRELDLRGMTGDEAIPLLDKFLDDALLAGYGRVDVIHGKGTGALRKKVVEFLQGHPRVRGVRIAEWNEGGMGATIVELSEGG
jgi:DNA mismatch repair protein MutS2